MSKEELLELTGDVIEKLPNAMFRVRPVSYTHLTLPTICSV